MKFAKMLFNFNLSIDLTDSCFKSDQIENIFMIF